MGEKMDERRQRKLIHQIGMNAEQCNASAVMASPSPPHPLGAAKPVTAPSLVAPEEH